MMKEIALQFTTFWREETFSKKFVGLLLIFLSQIFFLLLISFTGNEEHIFGSTGYVIANFFISKFLGITAFFFPVACMYWGYAWFLKKKNSGEIIRELLLLFSCFFSFNLLLLNGVLIDTKWAGLFPKFFHAIIYYTFGDQVGSVNPLSLVFESGLFIFSVFLFVKNYFSWTNKEVFSIIKKVTTRITSNIVQKSKVGGQKMKQWFKAVKSKVQSKPQSKSESGNSSSVGSAKKEKNKSVSWRKLVPEEIVLPLSWYQIHQTEQEKLNRNILIKLESKKKIKGLEKKTKPFTEMINENRGEDNDNVHQNYHGESLESPAPEIIDIPDSYFSYSQRFSSGVKNDFADFSLPSAHSLNTQLASAVDSDVMVAERITESPEREKKKAFHEGDYPLPSIINYKGENEDRADWLADDENMVFSPPKSIHENNEDIKLTATKLEETIMQFGIKTEVVRVSVGPVITQYELMLEPGVKINKILSLSDNIALALAAHAIRIVAPIPGKEVIGIEVPNNSREMVTLRDITAQKEFKETSMKLPIALGSSISGQPVITDLASTPHLLVAGATGSGKSVCVNSIIVSLLLQKSPLEVRFIMIDPKMVELNIYNGIPHLLAPVITDHKKAAWLLKWAISEMEVRYRLLEKHGVRNIASYNEMVKSESHQTHDVTTMPYIVIIIDEFADLMMVARKEIEESVSRLAAMSRAVGIHLILATQRPSVDVITGVIKANFPSRIAFQVSSKIDSRTIIDAMGAEKLLGRGDLLYQNVSSGTPDRIQGAFLSDDEVRKIVIGLKEKGKENYLPQLLKSEEAEMEGGYEEEDALFNQAIDIAIQERKVSASYLQRRLKIGYNRAARMIEMMEEKNIIGEADGSKPREVLI